MVTNVTIRMASLSNYRKNEDIWLVTLNLSRFVLFTIPCLKTHTSSLINKNHITFASLLEKTKKTQCSGKVPKMLKRWSISDPKLPITFFCTAKKTLFLRWIINYHFQSLLYSKLKRTGRSIHTVSDTVWHLSIFSLATYLLDQTTADREDEDILQSPDTPNLSSFDLTL